MKTNLTNKTYYKKLMTNTRLLKSIDSVKRDLENIIDELVAEIEEIESDKDKMQDEIDTLKETISELEDDIRTVLFKSM